MIRLKQRKLLIVGLTGFVLCVAFIFHFGQASSRPPTGRQIQNSSAKNAVILGKQEPVSSGLPLHLLIPKVAIDAAIEQVGLTHSGEMDVPKDVTKAAWYNRGPRPGEKGSAVIDGHFGWRSGPPAVFDNLHKLAKGDKLYVKDTQGSTTTFVVRASRSYDPAADASDVFKSNDGLAHLNLITCEGDWDKVSKSYTNRLVIFTDKE